MDVAISNQCFVRINCLCLNCFLPAVNVKTAEIFPATFPEKGPDEDLRSAHILTGARVSKNQRRKKLQPGYFCWKGRPLRGNELAVVQGGKIQQ